MAWTEAHENELKRRWNAGETASEIAAAMPALPGKSPKPITRDMVIGKARRMGLPSRPSPIRRDKADA